MAEAEWRRAHSLPSLEPGSSVPAPDCILVNTSCVGGSMVAITVMGACLLGCLTHPRHFICVPFLPQQASIGRECRKIQFPPSWDISTPGLGLWKFESWGSAHLAFPDTGQGSSGSCHPLSLCILSPADQVVPQYGAWAWGVTRISSVPDVHPWKCDPHASGRHPGLCPPAQPLGPQAPLPAQGGKSDPGQGSKGDAPCFPWV